MNLQELKKEISQYVYMEDDAVIDVALASIIANRLKLGDPVWMMIVGASSGGKSQIIRPLSMTDEKFIHRVDDITENTFLSGAPGGDMSLLKKIGNHGIITISDLTVLFSRNAESRNAILSQFRMLYDGEMIKIVGNRPEPLKWKGYLGVLSGGTPSIYSSFEEVADMGERFLCYRMKHYDERSATRMALSRKIFGRELDEKLSSMYAEYIKDIVMGRSSEDIPELTPEQMEKIIEISIFAERLRTVNKIDRFTKDIERIPTVAFPMRTALQLSYIARALSLMGVLDMKVIEWIGFSLANEEKREVLTLLSRYKDEVTTQNLADKIGLDTRIVRSVLQNLASTGIVVRSGDGHSLLWSIHDAYKERVASIVGPREELEAENRLLASEEITDEDLDWD